MANDLSRDDVLKSPICKVEGFDLLLEYAISQKMQKRKFLFEHSQTIDLGMIDLFDWRAYDPYIHADAVTGKVLPESLQHIAMHHLLVKHYGYELRGRPRATMLFEAVASNADFFFDLNIKLRRPRENSVFMTAKNFAFQLYGEKGGKHLLPLLQEGLSDPFALVKKSTRGMFQLYELLFQCARERNEKGSSDIRERLKRFLTHEKYAVLFGGYDLGGNVTFTIAWCGLESTPEDDAIVKDCLEKLDAAKSFTNFLGSLGVRSFIDAAAKSPRKAA